MLLVILLIVTWLIFVIVKPMVQKNMQNSFIDTYNDPFVE